jgi:hypothetical protein
MSIGSEVAGFVPWTISLFHSIMIHHSFCKMFTPSIMFFLLTLFVSADAASTNTVCAKLSKSISGAVFFTNDTQYQTEQSHYWNIGLATDSSACINLPDTVEKG